MRWPVRATGRLVSPSNRIRSAATASSGSIPEEEKSRSTITPPASVPRGRRRTVANRERACCSRTMSEAWLSADRDGKPADQCPGGAECIEICGNAREDRFERDHPGCLGQVPETPSPSPSSAPRRVCSQQATCASISEVEAEGFSLRSRVRRSSTPSSKSSRAVRNRCRASRSSCSVRCILLI